MTAPKKTHATPMKVGPAGDKECRDEPTRIDKFENHGETVWKDDIDRIVKNRRIPLEKISRFAHAARLAGRPELFWEWMHKAAAKINPDVQDRTTKRHMKAYYKGSGDDFLAIDDILAEDAQPPKRWKKPSRPYRPRVVEKRGAFPALAKLSFDNRPAIVDAAAVAGQPATNVEIGPDGIPVVRGKDSINDTAGSQVWAMTEVLEKYPHLAALLEQPEANALPALEQSMGTKAAMDKQAGGWSALGKILPWLVGGGAGAADYYYSGDPYGAAYTGLATGTMVSPSVFKGSHGSHINSAAAKWRQAGSGQTTGLPFKPPSAGYHAATRYIPAAIMLKAAPRGGLAMLDMYKKKMKEQLGAATKQHEAAGTGAEWLKELRERGTLAPGTEDLSKNVAGAGKSIGSGIQNAGLAVALAALLAGGGYGAYKLWDKYNTSKKKKSFGTRKPSKRRTVSLKKPGVYRIDWDDDEDGKPDESATVGKDRKKTKKAASYPMLAQLAGV